MRTAATLSTICSIFLIGCSTNNTVLVSTGTVIGVEIGQQPSTGMYQAKLGYNRAEVALVPSTNQYTPDVITELRYSGIFSTGPDSGIYQRLAVGSTAVRQPGAAALFLKDPSGTVSSNSAELIRALATVPDVDTSAVKKLAPIAAQYKDAADKEPWNEAAVSLGYTDFAGFILDRSTSVDKVDRMIAELKNRGIVK